MSVLTLVENWEGEFKKTSFETVSYGKEVASKLSSKLTTLTFGSKNPIDLNHYGSDENLNIHNMNFEKTSNMIIAKISAELIKEKNITTIIISNTNTGKSIAPLISHFLDFGILSNAIKYPDTYSPLTVLCKAFSGKAHAKYESNYDKNIITIITRNLFILLPRAGILLRRTFNYAAQGLHCVAYCCIGAAYCCPVAPDDCPQGHIWLPMGSIWLHRGCIWLSRCSK